MVAWRHCERIGEGERCELSDVVVSLHAIILVELVSVVAEEEERVEPVIRDIILKECELSLPSSCEVLITEKHDLRVGLTNSWGCGDRHLEGVGEGRDGCGIRCVALETNGVSRTDHRLDGEDN